MLLQQGQQWGLNLSSLEGLVLWLHLQWARGARGTETLASATHSGGHLPTVTALLGGNNTHSEGGGPSCRDAS